ncbi:MAG: DUF1345 domain-containing protein [Chitinivorax sp.]
MANYTPHYPLLLRLIAARPRLFSSALCGLATAALLPASWLPHLITRLILGWDAGACLYLLLAVHMMFASSHEKMRQRALREDEGQWLILLLVVIASGAGLAALGAELTLARELHGVARYAHIALVTLTLLACWLFTQLVFALHYAHDYYLALAQGHHGGLEFPGNEQPHYADFVYFACVIGTSAQTADVSFTTRRMRGVGTLHCVQAFLFNTTILALSVNIAAGLF